MQTKSLLKKGLAVGIILLFIGVAAAPSINSSIASQNMIIINDVGPRDSFGLQSEIDLSWDANQTSEPLTPGGMSRTITLNITYFCFKGTFGQLILFYYIITRQYINISLEAGDIPSWVTAYLSNSLLRFPISDASSTQSTFLIVAVNEYAPAFSPFMVEIKASVNDVFGPFGFLTLIQGCEVTTNPIFEAGYRPRIVVTPENYYLETSPGTTVIDPITVTNLGNHITTIEVDLIDVPQNWIVSIPPQIVLPVNDSMIMNLSITPPLDFYGIETINVSFTPKIYPPRPGCEGLPTNVTISVNVRP
jgi:hypothetical protein